MVGVLSKKEKINLAAYENKILRNVHFCIFYHLLRLHFFWIRNSCHGKDIPGYRVKTIGIVFWLSLNQPIIITYFYIFYFIFPKFTKIMGFGKWERVRKNWHFLLKKKFTSAWMNLPFLFIFLKKLINLSKNS